jgi:Protein of unknown function (DUF642)
MSFGIKQSTLLRCASRKAIAIGFSAALLLAAAISAQAGTNLVTNGDFESTTNGNGQLGFNTDVTGWTNGPSGYNFVFAPGTADSSGANGQFGNVTLWGPANGSNNGLTTSPTGGNFIAADGAFQVAPISQTINGLTAGNSYTVSFYWAGAQQSGFTGQTTEQWQVSFGNQEQSTIVLTNASHGFTGWQQQSFTFTADGSSDLLSFLAVGTPAGVPPFSLLDGVTLEATQLPEPATWTVLISGLIGGVGAFRMRKSVKS